MSEEAKIAYLREKIAYARGQSRAGTALSFIGLFLAVISYGWLGDFNLTILGLGGVVVGACLGLYFDVQKARLLDQLKQMGSTLKCPDCGKQIPQGNFAFCPFCGANLTSK